MVRLSWATDIHLNFAGQPVQEALMRSLIAEAADALLVTGDIGEAPNFDLYLERLSGAYGRPVYFVLGNHDFYRSSVVEVRDRARRLARPLHWLNECGVVELAPRLGLVGHDGWADARFGSYSRSEVMLNDFFHIAEFRGLRRPDRRRLMEKLAAEAAEHFALHLPAALERYEQVIVATHVPPFREATWHEGKISDDDWLPFFSSRVAGEAIAEASGRFPRCQVTVLCGHTHGEGRAEILPNLTVLTGGATYGKPALQAPLEIDFRTGTRACPGGREEYLIGGSKEPVT